MSRPLLLLFFLCLSRSTRLCAGSCPGREDLGPAVVPVTEAVEHGEGPVWDPNLGVLYFVDIHQGRLLRHDPSTGNTTFATLDCPVALVVPVRNSADRFVVGCGLDLALVLWDGVSSAVADFRVLASVDRDKPGNRFNDGKADRSGRVWAGTMGPEEVVGQVTPFRGSLYSRDPAAQGVRLQVANVSVSNGLAWTADDATFYYVDSPTDCVVAFRFDLQAGTLDAPRVVFNTTAHGLQGSPDGMTIDADGNLWVALFGGYKVVQVNPASGELLATVALPAERVTSVAFGGAALADLFVTTSRFGLSGDQLAQQPHAGKVFRVSGLGVRGLPAYTALL